MEAKRGFRNFFFFKDHSKAKYPTYLKKVKSHTNSDSRQLSDSYGEEVKGEEQARVERLAIPVGNTDRQQRRYSRNPESDRKPSNEKNRKSFIIITIAVVGVIIVIIATKALLHQKTGLRNRKTTRARAEGADSF